MATQELALSLSPTVPFSSLAAMATLGGGASEEESGRSLLSSSSSSLKQVEVMERLRQLMAWQERQRANLLRQQEEEINLLQREHQAPRQNGECGMHEQFEEKMLGGYITLKGGYIIEGTLLGPI